MTSYKSVMMTAYNKIDSNLQTKNRRVRASVYKKKTHFWIIVACASGIINSR